MTYTLEQLKKKTDKNGYLNLCGCTGLTSLPDNLTVGGSLCLTGCTGLTSLPDNLTVGGSLYLTGCNGLTSLPDNLTVSRFLDLCGCTGLTSLPDNLTVGSSLYLEGCTGLTSLPDNLTVGYSLYLEGCTGLSENYKYYHTLLNGDYVPGRYLYADGILTHIKRKKQIDKYTYYIGKIKGKNVISDGTYYAHCKNFEEGISDLAFKAAEERGAEQYKNLTKDSVVSFEEGRTMYRIITGACSAGTQQFIDNMTEKKESYSISEIIEMTKNAYGGEIFRKFFEED